MQASLAKMQSMMASRGVPPAAMAAMMQQAESGGAGGAGMPAAAMASMLTRPAGAELSGADGTALAAMLLERRRTTGEADGGAPRTDVASVRAVLGMCQGMQFPKPPGRNVEDGLNKIPE